LIVLSSTGEILTSIGVQEIYSKGADAILEWSQGKWFLFSYVAHKGEYVEQGSVSCSLTDIQSVLLGTALVFTPLISFEL
jgi:hypothetical protein